MRKPKIMTRALSEREEEMLKNAFGVPRFRLFKLYHDGIPVGSIAYKEGVPEGCIIWNMKKMGRALKKFEKKENLLFQIGDPFKDILLSEIDGISELQIHYLADMGIKTFQCLRDVICYDKEWLPIILRKRTAKKLVKIFKRHVGAAIYE